MTYHYTKLVMTIESLTESINHTQDDEYQDINKLSMNALLILRSNPSANLDLISNLMSRIPSLWSRQSIEWLNPLLIYTKSQYCHWMMLSIWVYMFFTTLELWSGRYRVFARKRWCNGKKELSLLTLKNDEKGSYPFIWIASNESYSLESFFWLLRAQPHFFLRSIELY